MQTPIYFTSPPRPARPAARQRFLIVVGLSGVGKSTLLRQLDYPVLPDRRELVNACILPAMGVDPGADRARRFEATRAYRRIHPGGVAHALAQGAWVPRWPLVFDGLRGETEAAYALSTLRKALFVVLEAPNLVRLKRLATRNDAFDRVGTAATGASSPEVLAEGVLSRVELQEALSWELPKGVLSTAIRIVGEEAKNYDPEGPRRVLGASGRALFVDTSWVAPMEIAERVRTLMEALRAGR